MSRSSERRVVRGAATLGLLVVAAFALAVLSLTVAAGGSDGGEESGSPASSSSSGSSGRSSGRRVSVPDVLGFTEAQAVKALGASGLVANVRLAKEAPRTGAVLRSVPEPGSEVPARSVVVLAIALDPPLPRPEPEDEQELHALGRLVEDNPDTFVGLYLDGEGIPHVVYGPGIDLRAWSPRVEAAAAGARYRTETCSRDRTSLGAVKDRVAAKDWTANPSLAFSVDVHPSTCTVRVESDLLTSADVEALVERFGTTISLDTTEGSHPVLLPFPG